MPDAVEISVNTFMNNIQRIEDELKDDLGRLAYKMKDMTDTELLNTTKRLNFLQELVDKGYGDEINNLMDDYDKVLAQAVKEASNRGITLMGTERIEALQQLKDLDTQRLLGRANAYGNDLKKLLFRNIYSNTSITTIVAELGETSLATHQLNVAVNTGLRQFSDFSRYSVFKGEDVRWTYVGTQDSRTRPACVSTNSNEPLKGYTEEQVQSSGTPFGTRGGFNCRHSWMVA
jgi:hypothetical protein|tara:strand:+ start:7268 stop:7963 length:696 start_codon:yes stop_codon:yes gene_type:complete